jgi:hypothetical protein
MMRKKNGEQGAALGGGAPFEGDLEGYALWRLSLVLSEIAQSTKQKELPEANDRYGKKNGRPKRSRLGQKRESEPL